MKLQDMKIQNMNLQDETRQSMKIDYTTLECAFLLNFKSFVCKASVWPFGTEIKFVLSGGKMFYRQGSNWAMELDRVVFCLRFFFQDTLETY